MSAWPSVVGLLVLTAHPVQQTARSAAALLELDRRHEESVRAERTAAFLEELSVATPERRAEVLALERRLRQPGRRPGSRPTLEELARLHDTLRGRDGRDTLQRLVDALDLRAIPGAVPATTEGHVHAIQVWVRSLWHVPVSGDVSLQLDWIAPGGGREPARRERVSTANLTVRGFPMYVRAPRSEAGTWSLLPILQREGRSAEGNPIPIEAVTDLDRRLAVLAPRTWPRSEPPLEALLELGIRWANGLSVSTCLDLAAGRAAATGEFAPSDRFDAGLRPYVLEGSPSSPAVVYLSPAEERSETLLVTSLGEATGRARAAGLLAVSLEASLERRSELAEGLGRLREEGHRLVLVARGEAVVTLHLLFARGELPADALVLVGPQAPGPGLPPLPTLWIASESEEGGVQGEAEGSSRPGLRILRDPRPGWMLDPELPLWVADWVQGG